jgi:hypothetical protein
MVDTIVDSCEILATPSLADDESLRIRAAVIEKELRT